MACLTELTYIYSSPCISYLRELVESLKSTFSITETIDDMFYYGVYCKPETYAYFKHYDACDEYVPDLLRSSNESNHSKLLFVKGEIEDCIKTQSKHGWMFYVEETESFNKFEDAPSTFLYIIPKEERFRKFGEALTNFLYSPNLMVTLKND